MNVVPSGPFGLITADDLLPELEGFNQTLIALAEDVIYLLSPALTLIAFNQGWVRFALENGGEQLLEMCQPGMSILSAMSGTMAASIRKHYGQVLLSKKPFIHAYECSSPDEKREFLQVVYPLKAGQGVMVTNSQLYTRHKDVENILSDRQITDIHGSMKQCMHCQRVARQDAMASWEWVPELSAAHRPFISHTLCSYCLDHYYSE